MTSLSPTDDRVQERWNGPVRPQCNSPLDPRRRPLSVKDLRAYAASVVVDSGGTQYEAAALLHHSTVQTTNRYYARAQDERSQDPARASLRVDLTMTLPERIDALWTAWVTAYPDQTADLLDPQRDSDVLEA